MSTFLSRRSIGSMSMIMPSSSSSSSSKSAVSAAAATAACVRVRKAVLLRRSLKVATTATTTTSIQQGQQQQQQQQQQRFRMTSDSNHTHNGGCWDSSSRTRTDGTQPRSLLSGSSSIATTTTKRLFSSSSSESSNSPSSFSSSEATTTTTTPRRRPKTIPPEDVATVVPQVWNVATGYFAGQALYSLLRLRIPDLLGDDTLSVKDLIARMSETNDGSDEHSVHSPAAAGVQEETLERIMRYVSVTTPFFEMSSSADDQDTAGAAVFALTAAGALLQSHVPQQPYLGCLIEHYHETGMWNAWGKLPEYVRGETPDSQPPFTAANGMPIFEWYAREQELAGHPFNQVMAFITHGQEDAIVKSYDWNRFAGKTIVDVGGSHGLVVSTIQKAFPDISCISLDLPQVIRDLSPEEKATNIEYVAGDMFDPSTFPPICDVIYMKSILHDWSDQDCIKILQSCRRVLDKNGNNGDGGTVIVNEHIVPSPQDAQKNPQDAASIFQVDMIMMQIQGKERSKQQWETLADAGGFVITDITIPPRPALPFITMKKKN